MLLYQLLFRIEVDQPALLSCIVDVVHGGSAADNRRRTPMLRTSEIEFVFIFENIK
jgi:hypothetical protein